MVKSQFPCYLHQGHSIINACWWSLALEHLFSSRNCTTCNSIRGHINSSNLCFLTIWLKFLNYNFCWYSSSHTYLTAYCEGQAKIALTVPQVRSIPWNTHHGWRVFQSRKNSMQNLSLWSQIAWRLTLPHTFSLPIQLHGSTWQNKTICWIQFQQIEM